MKTRFKVILVAAATVLVGSQLSTPVLATQPALQAGNYIVTFADNANEQSEAAKLRGQGVGVRFTYSKVFKGLAGSFNAAQLAALQKNPNVVSIEEDGVVSADATTTSPASWGLDRIDQNLLPLSNTYSYTNNGTGVNAYIIDTGIYSTHSDFGGRVKSGYTAVADGNGTEDCAGHGTHVAGTVGGAAYGVAKNVNLIPVRVLDCAGSGTNSGVIAGLDWVAKNRVLPAVANMSLGGGKSSAINTAVANVVKAGVIVSVAAGNSNADACRYSPSSEPSAITVGATTNTDARASYSNYGTCLDIFAPGSSITSDYLNGGTAIMSGTSMATPHVTGVAALYAQSNGSNPSAFATWLSNLASKNLVTSAGKGSKNYLLFSNL